MIDSECVVTRKLVLLLSCLFDSLFVSPPTTQSLSQSLSHSVSQSVAHSVTQSLSHSLKLSHSVTHSSIQPLAYSQSQSLTHSLTHSPINFTHYFLTLFFFVFLFFVFFHVALLSGLPSRTWCKFITVHKTSKLPEGRHRTVGLRVSDFLKTPTNRGAPQWRHVQLVARGLLLVFYVRTCVRARTCSCLTKKGTADGVLFNPLQACLQALGTPPLHRCEEEVQWGQFWESRIASTRRTRRRQRPPPARGVPARNDSSSAIHENYKSVEKCTAKDVAEKKQNKKQKQSKQKQKNEQWPLSAVSARW